MLGDELGHLEHVDLALSSEDGLQGVVGIDHSAVLAVLQLVSLDIGPELLGHFGARYRLGAHYFRQHGAWGHGFHECRIGFSLLGHRISLLSNTSCLGDAARTVRATRECVNQREMSTTFKRLFWPSRETSARPGDRFAIIKDPFSLTISCHPRKRSGNRQKKRRRPRLLPGTAG